MKDCFTSETVEKMRNRLLRRKKERKKEITNQREIFQTKLQIPQPKAVPDISNFLKSMKTVNLKTVQTCSRGKTKTEFMNPDDSRQDKKLRGGSKISKIWENSCSCNNW